MSLTTEIQQFQDEAREGWMPEKGVDPAAEIMTDEQMRIAIAEACGWTKIDRYIGQEKMSEGLLKGQNPKYKKGKKEELPNYPLDLNACAEFEKTLTDKELWQIDAILFNLPDCRAPFVATARQRCLAYLKTKGLIP